MRRPNDRPHEKQPNKKGLGIPEWRRRTGSLTLLSVLLLAVWMAHVLAEEPAGKDLRLFYQQNCVGCHGPDGSALSPDGTKLSGQDLTNPRWLQRTGDEEMVKVILNGKFFGLAMPRFKDKLSKDEAQRMVTDIIRKSKKGNVIEPKLTGTDGK